MINSTTTNCLIHRVKGLRLYSTAKFLPRDVVIVAAARTPVGSMGKSLAAVPATDLGAVAIKGVLERAKPASGALTVDEVIFGNVVSANIGQAPARQCALKAGLPESTITTSVNKVCASGMKTITLGAQSIALGHSNVIVAGGTESMSNVPYYLEKARTGFRYGHQSVTDGIIKDGLWDSKYNCHMGECAEDTAAKFSIGREEQDAHAIESYKRAEKAVKEGLFKAEIVPVPLPGRKGAPVTFFSEDEEYKNVDFAKVPSLKPVFRKEGGTVTAANASTLNDGASAVLLTSLESSKAHGLKPLARILSFADHERNPKEFTIAPAYAIPKALKLANISQKDVSLFEINEAFSVVVLANQEILKLDPSQVNIAGGGVSLGHPIGSSGCRIVVSLIHLLKKGQIGVAAICNGGGGATAIVIEKLV